MHIVRITDPIELASDDTIQPGAYLAEDIFGGQMLVMAGGGTMEPLVEKRVVCFGGSMYMHPPELAGTNHPELFVEHTGRALRNGINSCRSLLFGRSGGLGDLTLLTPVLREIKRRWPSVKIAVATIKELGQSLQNLPFVDELIQYPIPMAVAEQYDGWVWLENAIEKNPDAKELHSVDCVAKFIGLTLPEDCDKNQAYVVTDKERAWAQWAFPRIGGTKRLCVQVKASALCRTYPKKKTGEVIGHFLKAGWEVFILGQPGEVKLTQPEPGLRVVADGVTFRQRCAILETADAFFGPDSSLVHIAGALGIPAVGLYGPFDWKVRTKYSPTTVCLSRKEGFPCAPCGHHAGVSPSTYFPKDCPTKAQGMCGVLDGIEPSQIIAKIEKIAKRLPEEGDGVVAFEAAATQPATD